jgi:predicted porin
MKKSLLAVAAMTAFAGAAQAQSSVTVYGLMDQGVIAQSNQNIRDAATPVATATATMNWGASPQGQNSTTMPFTMGAVLQTSRLGFKGSEDMGGGLKTVFTLETGLKPEAGTSSNTSVLFNRQSFVGLENNMVTATFGRQYLFGYESAGAGITDPLQLAFDISNGNTLGGVSAAQAGASNTGSTAATGILKVNPMNSLTGSMWGMDRANNSLKFKSKPIGGAYVGAMYALGAQSGNTGANAGQSLVAGWGGYDVRVEATATSINDNSSMGTGVNSATLQTQTRKSQQWSLGGTYQVTPAIGTQLGYTANSMDAGFQNNAAGGALSTTAGAFPAAFFGSLGQKVKLSATTAGVNYMITPTIKATVGYVRSNLTGDFINSGSANTYSTIVNYYLSKRTDLYAIASNTAVKDGLYSNVGGNTTYNNNGQKVTTTMAIGMRHTF